MENSWQVKYISTLSSSSTSHHQRNQMGVNAGHGLYPHFDQDHRPLHGEYQGHTLPNITNLSSDRPVQADNSYVSLLSGSSSSVLQSDFHELLNPKLITTSSKLCSGGGSFNVSAGSGVPLSSTGLLPENLSSHNMKNGAEYGVAVSSIRAVSSHSSGYSVLLDNCQSVGSWAPLASAGLLSENLINQNVQNRTEIFPVVSSRPVGEWCGTSPLSGGELRSADIRRLEVNSSPSTQPSTSKSVCPRVFCLGKSGHLLLSNTGLIGILCSCHSHNMSVSKFCEHSGLRDINPGEAVRMDSGETIAQWRKLYFQRFGIRVPDDHSGWDWPEGISSAAGVRKSSGSIPSMSIDSNLAHPGALPADFMMPGLPLGSISLPDNHHVGQSRNLHERKQRNASGLTDNQTARCPISSCSTNCGYPCLHNTMGSTVNIGNSSENQFSLRNHGKNSDIGRIKNPRDNVIIDKDNASSNVELRLGQPYHQSHSLGNPVLSVVGSKGLDRRAEPLKSLFSEQMILNAKCGEKESRQYRLRAAVHSDTTAMRGHSQLNLENKVLGHKTTISADRLEGSMGDMANNSVHPLKHFNGPPVGSLSLEVRDNLATMNMPKKLSFNTHTANCDLVGGLGNGCNNTKKELNVSELSLFQLRDKGKAIRCISDASNVGTSLIHKVQKQIENPSSFSGVVGGSFERSLSAAHDKIVLSSQLPNVPLNAFSAKNPSGNSEKVFCIGSGGHTDQMFFRSTGPPKCPVQVLPAKPISMNLPTSYSISTSAVTQATSKQDSPGVIPYFLDESMRLLALGQIVELSKQQQELSILGVNQKHRRFGDSQNVNIRHSSVNLSTSAEHKNVQNPSCSLDASDVAVKSFSRGFTDRINNSIETLVPSTGLNACCNTSKSAQGISSSGGTDVQRRCFRDSVMNDCPTLRAPYTHFHCSHNRATSATRLVGNCDSAAGSCPNTFREWMRGPNREASKAVALESVETDFLPKAETISSAQGRLIEGQLHRNGVGPVPQWRDVPSKLQRVCDVSADISNCKEQDEGQVGYGVGDTSAKCYNGGLQVDDSLKNQEMSNVSSGCSAPIVTHASNDVNNMDSSIVDAEDGGYASYSAVDEGSGIDNDKCWSSDDSLESERSAEFTGSNRTDFKKQGSCRSITNQSSCSLLQELKLLDFLTWKKGRNQIPNELTTSGKTDHPENFVRDTEAGERKKPMKSKFRDASFLNTSPTIHCNGPKDTGTSHEVSRCSKDLPKHLSVIPKHYSSGTSSHTNSNSGAHSLSLAEAPSRQRDLYALYSDRAVEDDYRTGFGGNGNCCETIEASGRKKCKRKGTYKTLRHFQTPETPDADANSSPNFNSVGYMKASSGQPSSISYKKDRPVVCGIYGEISGANLEGDNSKPVKYLSLSQIIKSTKKCVLKKSKPRLISSSELKNTRHGDTNSSGDTFLSLKKLEENGSHSPSFYDKINVDLYEEETKRACSDDDKWFAHGSSMLEKEKDCQSEKDNIQVQLKPKCKEIRKRSLYELTLEGNTSRNICSPPITKSKCIRKEKMRKVLHSAEATQCHNHSSCNVDTEKSIQKQQCFSNVDSDAICCVCGSLNQDDLNCILKCSQCLIKVHQACYGVSRVPKGRWSCRPCTATAKDIVCVLCGYGGGAMTRALGSRAIVKSLLKAWNIESEDQPKNIISPFETSANTSGVLSSFGSVINGNLSSVLKPIHMEPSNAGEIKMDEQNQEGFTQGTPSDVGNLKKVHNSITAGISDPSVRQWIHMVCGLWTPTTRCPNVYTMGAFDVSDTLHPGSDVACSICKRPGGSSIQCRVLNCSVRFHPWCAHQKGLLQSEVEGVDNESVGFYGRCVSHATFPMWDSDTDNMDVQTNCSREEFTCARTEGYKGRKRDGVSQNLYGQSNRKKGCLVPQEQLNAWTHINGQKWTHGLPKLPISDVEYDCRKEYARYKHAKGWKRLVVYKSGIHALGLYTSQFISRGEMVVEYVGEIVGTRVVDKRENEYLSGRKLQYESACYFFRVDKEHTIDATCKGGIARFVNHSCWPNCVAKVISVRNEKKVVFFADRDIYPGEEVTYDYHFNHEDEGA